jgi:hypothetical protein
MKKFLFFFFLSTLIVLSTSHAFTVLDSAPIQESATPCNVGIFPDKPNDLLFAAADSKQNCMIDPDCSDRCGKERQTCEKEKRGSPDACQERYATCRAACPLRCAN